MALDFFLYIMLHRQNTCSHERQIVSKLLLPASFLALISLFPFEHKCSRTWLLSPLKIKDFNLFECQYYIHIIVEPLRL